MKISCDTKKNFFECTSEAMAVAKKKNKILKKKTTKILNTFEEMLIVFAVSMFIVFFMMLSSMKCHYLYAFTVFLIAVLYFAISFFSLINAYCCRKKCKPKTIIIDENGITDESFWDIKMNFGWKKIKAVVVKDYSVTILTDTPCYFYFPITQKKKLLSAIKKYNEKVLIIGNQDDKEVKSNKKKS